MDSTGKKNRLLRVHEARPRDSQWCGCYSVVQRKTGHIDLEAVEMMVACWHDTGRRECGADGDARIRLRWPVSASAALPLRRHRGIQGLRSKTRVDRSGKGGSVASLLLVRTAATRASSRLMPRLDIEHTQLSSGCAAHAGDGRPRPHRLSMAPVESAGGVASANVRPSHRPKGCRRPRPKSSTANMLKRCGLAYHRQHAPHTREKLRVFVSSLRRQPGTGPGGQRPHP